MFVSLTSDVIQSGLKNLRPWLPASWRLGFVLIIFALLNQPAVAQIDASQPTREESTPTTTSATDMLRAAQTLHIHSGTKFFDPFQLESELQQQTEFAEWNLLLVDKPEAADVQVEIDRPLFTYTFNYRVVDRRTSVVLATGKVTAFNGSAAAPKLAKEILQRVKASRPPRESKLKTQAEFVDKPLTIPAATRALKKPAGIEQGAQDALTKAPLIIARPPAEPPQ